MRFLRLYITISLLTFFVLVPYDTDVAAASSDLPLKMSGKSTTDPILQQRLELFQQWESLYGIPWTFLAAVDQYERTMKKRGKAENEASKRLTAITIPPSLWCGVFNPEQDDIDPTSISFFEGIGQDGDGDGLADANNDRDVLATFIHLIGGYGFSPEDFRIGLWMYYQRDQAVRTIVQFARLYDKFQTLDLGYHAFPIPKRYEYSYRSTWGDARGWGGRRIHEGTDIFANNGTPVLSTGYGVVEIMGWNRYGGWRVGIRDMDNIYHYFAHLSAFRKGLKPGDIVEPGQVIGYVGSSGYGRPGTSGKFPPHLHYGMYRDVGFAEWAFDPYPHLKQWERQMYKKKANK